jgi:hypothetical protein
MSASRLPGLLASVDESLNDRRTMRWAIAGALILGAAIRFAWIFHGGFGVIQSEAFFEAAAFATRGELADAYGPDTGLTAHLSPGMPLLVGTVYRWLGVGTPIAEFALSCLSLAFIYIGFQALNAAFERLGAAPIARFGAIVVLALVPLNIFFEMKGFRHWEGALAAAGIALFLARSLTLDAREEPPGWLDLGLLAAAAGVLSLFSPQAALAGYGMLGWLALRKRGWLGFAATAAASAVLLVAISFPWALRNEAVFGQKVWTRSSFGISFAVAYDDTEVNPSDPGRLYPDRLREVSPFLNPPVLAKMQAAGGELGWDRFLIGRTEQWIREHPVSALKITARHVWEFYFPPLWMWLPDTGIVAILEQAVMWAIAAIGFVGLGDRIAGRDWRYVYVLAALFLTMAPYALVQAVVRYRYPIGALLVFLAADTIVRATRFMSNRLRTTHQTGDFKDSAERGL